jgi:hypothetical protein
MLHHATSLDELLERSGRKLFCDFLDKYWNSFAWDWDVLLHANPAASIYNATKLAGGGELGIGVGEEEWGSGEREVLEDFVHRTEGLVDVVVGRYGKAPHDFPKAGKAQVNEAQPQPRPWLGTGDHPSCSDGIIFSGVGALSKRSLATVSQWMDAIFTNGENAFGVGDNPTSRPRHRNSRKTRAPNGQSAKGKQQASNAPARVTSPRGSRSPDLRRKAIENNAAPPSIPPPLVGTVERSLDQAIANVQKKGGDQNSREAAQPDSSYFDTDKMMSYLKLGYGSSWTLNPKGFEKEGKIGPIAGSDQVAAEQEEQPDSPSLQELDPTPDISDEEEEPPFVQRLEQSIGKFLIGLSGDLENTEFEDDTTDTGPSSRYQSQRLFLRTLILQLSRSHQTDHQSTPTKHNGSSTSTKLQVVIYVHQPFIFTFLFSLRTSQLSMPSFYRNIHHQLGPLQKPLLRSTDPARIPERIAQYVHINPSGTHTDAEDILNLGLHDLIYDPVKLTVRTTIPNVPIPGTLGADGLQPSSSRTVSGAWYTLGIPISSSNASSTRSPSASLAGASTNTSPRPDASSSVSDADTQLMPSYTRPELLSLHSQILTTYIATRPSHTAVLHAGSDEFERTIRSTRWWVCLLRVSRSLGDGKANTAPSGSMDAGVNKTSDARDMASPTTALGGSDATGLKEGMGTGITGLTDIPRTPTLKRDETEETDYANAFGGEGREAFIVRKVDIISDGGKSVGSGSARRWLYPSRDVGGSAERGSGGRGNVGVKGVVEGVGVDARRWVEGVGRMS